MITRARLASHSAPARPSGPNCPQLEHGPGPLCPTGPTLMGKQDAYFRVLVVGAGRELVERFRKGVLCNVRAETVATKFAKQLRRQRCLIPIDGFYEWRLEGTVKQPYYIRRADDEPIILAGLSDVWRSPEAGREPEPSCTIVTTEPNRLMRPIHDRMPVILEPQHYQLWLDTGITDPDAVLSLLRPYAPEELIA